MIETTHSSIAFINFDVRFGKFLSFFLFSLIFFVFAFRFCNIANVSEKAIQYFGNWITNTIFKSMFEFSITGSDLCVHCTIFIKMKYFHGAMSTHIHGRRKSKSKSNSGIETHFWSLLEKKKTKFRKWFFSIPMAIFQNSLISMQWYRVYRAIGIGNSIKHFTQLFWVSKHSDVAFRDKYFVHLIV